MPGYRAFFVPAVSENLLCRICHLPVRRAVQVSVCGHRFCDSCLNGAFSNTRYANCLSSFALDLRVIQWYAIKFEQVNLNPLNEGKVNAKSISNAFERARTRAPNTAFVLNVGDQNFALYLTHPTALYPIFGVVGNWSNFYWARETCFWNIKIW